ncbi:MAG: DUF484 family protein [Pseudomonadota bacterium]
MTAAASDRVDPTLRKRILKDPEAILDDPDLMRALVTAHDGIKSGNIVDMRGIAMQRLETRLDRLETTHRSVIAAAYDNLAGTNQVHRAVLKLLEPITFPDFLHAIKHDLAEVMRVDFIRLVLETQQAAPDPSLAELGDILVPAPPGFVLSYLNNNRTRAANKVVLRQVQPDDDLIYGEYASFIQSEACLKLDFGTGTLPALLVLGSDDPHQFSPSQGIDLLSFLASVFERAMRRWLA